MAFNWRSTKQTAIVALLGLMMGTGSYSGARAADRGPVSDQAITAAVSDRLFTDRYFAPEDVHVITAEGMLTLTGIVDTLRSRDRAVGIAEGIRGVRAVVDRLEIRTSNKKDDQIRKDVQTALRIDPTTEHYRIQVASVKDGKVRLKGTVGSYAERSLASWVTKGVTGVKDVKNDITLEYPGTRSDAEIAQDVQGKLRSDPAIADDRMKVSVKNSAVKITGNVASLAEKNHVFDDAWGLGVRSVDTSGVRLKEITAREMERSKTPATLSAAKIKKTVKEALLYDPRVRSFKPDVQVTGGFVTLTGTVDSAIAKRAAEQDARNTLGVVAVTNGLEVKPPAPVTDGEIAQRAKTNLDIFAPRVSKQVNISVARGNVTLRGSVNSSYEKWQAWDAAARVAGVKNIENKIAISPSSTIAKLSDDQIRKGARSFFKSDAALNFRDSLNVDVQNGTATLTGSVDTWAQSVSATQDAFLAGARDVINRLEVRSAPIQSLTEARYYSTYPESLYQNVFPVGVGPVG